MTFFGCAGHCGITIGRGTGAERKQMHQDNKDWIEIEREFSVEKHSYGLG